MTEKRKFYNTGDAKGFTKAMFFLQVKNLVSGEDVVPEDVMNLISKACEYELEGIENRTSGKVASGEKKDPMESEYAVVLQTAILPLVTGEPKTARELINQATQAGKLAPSGKEFAAPWVSRVMNSISKDPSNGIVALVKIIDKIDAKGLKSQTQATAYQRA